MTAAISAMRLRLTLGLAVVGMALALLVPSGASAASVGTFSCRASAARILLPGGLPTIEPFVANKADSPCLTDSENVLVPTTVGPLTVNAVNVLTVNNGLKGARAASKVTDPTVNLGSGALLIHADVVTAAAGYLCMNGKPQEVNSGQVVALSINGHTITIPPGINQTITIPGVATLVLNRVVITGTSVTRQAIYLTSPVGTVVLSEATADLTNNPCSTGTARIVITPPGAARLISSGRCVKNTFRATVVGTDISRVVFSLNGKRIATRTSSPYRVSITPPAGHDTLKARVTFTVASATAPRTLTVRFKGCPGGHAHLVITPKGAARLIAEHRCVHKAFTATVVGSDISRVVFSENGTVIATRTSKPFSVRITPTPGHHTLTANVTFTRASHTKSKTLRVSFIGCSSAPSFTG
jgi:hypothetical protein